MSKHDQTGKLFLDDVRPAPDDSWTIVRSYDDFVAYISRYGVPDLISFDHDLGAGKSGYDCAKWLMENGYCLKMWRVHSMNPVGRDNIKFLLARNGQECS